MSQPRQRIDGSLGSVSRYGCSCATTSQIQCPTHGLEERLAMLADDDQIEEKMDYAPIGQKERVLLREIVDFLLEKADWRSDDDKPGWSLLPCEQAIYIEDDWLDRACAALGINPLEGD